MQQPLPRPPLPHPHSNTAHTPPELTLQQHTETRRTRLSVTPSPVRQHTLLLALLRSVRRLSAAVLVKAISATSPAERSAAVLVEVAERNVSSRARRHGTSPHAGQQPLHEVARVWVVAQRSQQRLLQAQPGDGLRTPHAAPAQHARVCILTKLQA